MKQWRVVKSGRLCYDSIGYLTAGIGSSPRHRLCVQSRGVTRRCPWELGISMRVEPLGDKVVVKRLAADSKTAGGIVLPDSAKERPREGRVLSVGDGVLRSNGTRAPHQVREGDRVVFSSYAGHEIVVDDEELLIMSESEILAILD